MPDAPASDTAMKFADYVLENYYCCGFEFSANLVGATAGLVNAAYKQWRRVLSQPSECRILCKAFKHIHVCRRTVLKKIQQQFVTTGTHIKSEREKRQFIVTVYFDYRRQVLTRKEFLKK